jgi:hypothetical protein
MPYKDPEKRRIYQREYKKMRRGSQTKSKTLSKTLCQTLQEYKLEDMKDIHELLTKTINEVSNLKCQNNSEVLAKARVIGFLVGYMIQVINAGGVREDKKIELVIKGLDEGDR